MTPSDLDAPLQDDNDRARMLAEFLGSSIQLDEWRLAATGQVPLSDQQRQVLQNRVSIHEPAESTLRRWWNLFRPELEAVMGTRNRVVHGFGLSDAELRHAHWLASNLLESLASVPQPT